MHLCAGMHIYVMCTETSEEKARCPCSIAFHLIQLRQCPLLEFSSIHLGGLNRKQNLDYKLKCLISAFIHHQKSKVISSHLQSKFSYPLSHLSSSESTHFQQTSVALSLTSTTETIDLKK